MTADPVTGQGSLARIPLERFDVNVAQQLGGFFAAQ